MTDGSRNRWSRRQILKSTAALSTLAYLTARANATWDTSIRLPLRVQEIYPCLHQGSLWVAGGLGPDAPVAQQNINDSVLRFDLEEGLWSNELSLPEPRHHGFLVSIGNELLLFSGFVAANGGRWSASRDVLRLSDAGWSLIATLPAAQCETVTAVNRARVHLAGGRAPGRKNADWGDQRDVATHQVFDADRGRRRHASPSGG